MNMLTNVIDIPGVMNTLATQRKAYHSEADFQHAFAWEVHHRLPTASVRLERPLTTKGKTLHLDFMIELPEARIAIELKYKTRKLSVTLDSEEFQLANHSAVDCGRYDFVKDICRIEHIASNVENCGGCAILLTNDSLYWKPSRTKGNVDEAFHLTEGRTLHGPLGWAVNASAGTIKNREGNLQVDGQYKLNWNDYTIASESSNGQFRYLIVNVPGNGIISRAVPTDEK